MARSPRAAAAAPANHRHPHRHLRRPLRLRPQHQSPQQPYLRYLPICSTRHSPRLWLPR